MSSPACFVSTIDLSLKDKLEKDLLEQGFELTAAPYAFFSAKKSGISCNLYLSGKITVQGKGKDEFIAFYLEPEILKNLSYTYPSSLHDLTPHIGLDEAGKGDFFGPLCIAGLYAGEGQVDLLVKMGVRDSKKLSDETILALSKKIKASFSYKVLQLFPETYNNLYSKFNNLNRLLAWGHATVLQELSEKTTCKKATLDQFAPAPLMEEMLKRKKLDIELLQRFKGEEDPVVAGASILARAAFVEGIDKLAETYQTPLPKGASSPVLTAGKRAIEKHGPEILTSIAKTHFKTTQALLHD